MLELENKISKSELENLYINKKMPDSHIAKMFGVSLGKIHRLRNKYGIQAIEYHQRHHKQILDNKEKEFLIGCLLGDGHLRWRKEKRSYPQLMIEQTTKHKEYLFWLKNEIKDWLYDPYKPIKQTRKLDKRTNKVYHSYPFQTICHPCFIEFYNNFYNNKIKEINIEFISKYFSYYSFAIWIMDDGMISKKRNISICTHSFTEKENETLSKFIKNKYNLNSHLSSHKDGKIYYYLTFDTESSLKLSKMIKEYIVPSMIYKLISSETTKEESQIRL